MDLPEGYLAVDAFPGGGGSALRVCLVVRREPDPVDGHLVVVRSVVNARVLLACLADAAGRVHQWLELWVQQTDYLIHSLSACRDLLSNAALDARWQRHVEGLEAVGAEVLVRTGWETSHPPPAWLDLAAAKTAYLTEPASGHRFELCCDEALLAAKRLPGYRASLHRYLYVPDLGEASPLVPVSAKAPTSADTSPLEEFLPASSSLVPVNPAAGFMMVRPHAPIGIEAFVDFLGGAEWDSLVSSRAVTDIGDLAEALRNEVADGASGGRLFLGRHGREGRLIETFHLKLRLLADAFSAVQGLVRHHRRPLLSLSANSFRVRLGGPGRGLPFLWTAAAMLVDPGDAVALPIQTTDAEYFVPAGEPTLSIYRPEPVSAIVRGHGSARIRQVQDAADGTVVVEGTLVTHDRIRDAGRDLLWIRLNLPNRGIDLYACFEADSALAVGEWRFRTLPQQLSPVEAKSMRAAVGMPIADAPFEVIPLLGTPCDLYSLGVLAVRALLAGSTNALPVALDETLSLAGQVAAQYDESRSLQQRIQAVFEHDDRWMQALGPHRLNREGLAPKEALDRVPADLWFETLAMLVRLFPGAGPDSECGDWGDAPVGGPHRVFDRAVGDLDRLLIKTRSLIVGDGRVNREVHAIIRRFLGGLDQGKADAGH